jgi:hypothetical protein
MIEYFNSNLTKEELEEYIRKQEIERKRIEDEQKARFKAQDEHNAKRVEYENEQKKIAQEKKDKEWAKVWGPEEEKKRISEESAKQAQNTANIIKYVVGSVVGVIVLIILIFVVRSLLTKKKEVEIASTSTDTVTPSNGQQLVTSNTQIVPSAPSAPSVRKK